MVYWLISLLVNGLPANNLQVDDLLANSLLPGHLPVESMANNLRADKSTGYRLKIY